MVETSHLIPSSPWESTIVFEKLEVESRRVFNDDGDRWRCRDVGAFVEVWTQHLRGFR